MKKIILITFCIALFGCNQSQNVIFAKKWVQAFETSNVELWKEVVSEDLMDVSPMYGMGHSVLHRCKVQ